MLSMQECLTVCMNSMHNVAPVHLLYLAIAEQITFDLYTLIYVGVSDYGTAHLWPIIAHQSAA